MVVSDSPHLMLTVSSASSIRSRRCSVACWTKSTAVQHACRTISSSPFRSIEKPATGLPVAAIPSTIRSVQVGSIPITIAAATFGFAPVPIIVRKCRSRSSPYWSRPYACGSASVPLIFDATASQAALEMSSTGRTITWLRMPTEPSWRR